MTKYTDNLEVIGNNVFSYNTHVATISGGEIIAHGYYSKTTSKHINYVADEYCLTIIKDYLLSN
jgi:hypothetical protein